MRRTAPASFALALMLAAGCAGPGDHGPLRESGTDCPDAGPLADGFDVRLTAPRGGLERLVGRCMTIAHDGRSVDEPFAARRVAADGTTWLPVEGPGRYYLTVSANEDRYAYCQLYAGELIDHPGRGVVVAEMEAGTMCA